MDYVPEMERRLRRRLKPTNDSSRVDEPYVRVKGKLLDIVYWTDQNHYKTPIMGSSLGGAGLSELENPENEELFIPPISRPTYWSQCSGPAKNCDIATVNNPAMIELQNSRPNSKPIIRTSNYWVVVEENILRQRVTTDVSREAGSST
jgi:hypothetical protein